MTRPQAGTHAATMFWLVSGGVDRNQGFIEIERSKVTMCTRQNRIFNMINKMKKMTSSANKEIELKFLVKGNEWKNLTTGIEIRQAFISSHPQRIVRVRIYGDKAFLTIKGEKKGDGNPEFEWEVSKNVAEEMVATRNLIEGYEIHKKRYVIEDYNINWEGAPLKWEVDEFFDENAPLQIAEMELPPNLTPDQLDGLKQDIIRNLPDWVGDYLDFTSDPSVSRYFNNNLSISPFSTWDEKDKDQMLKHLT